MGLIITTCNNCINKDHDKCMHKLMVACHTSICCECEYCETKNSENIDGYRTILQ